MGSRANGAAVAATMVLRQCAGQRGCRHDKRDAHLRRVYGASFPRRTVARQARWHGDAMGRKSSGTKSGDLQRFSGWAGPRRQARTRVRRHDAGYIRAVLAVRTQVGSSWSGVPYQWNGAWLQGRWFPGSLGSFIFFHFMRHNLIVSTD